MSRPGEERRGWGPLQGWLGWILGALFFFYIFFQRVAPSAIIDELMRDLAASGALIGTLSAFYFYAYVLVQVPVGVLVDRFGPRRMLTLAALGAGAGSLLFAFSETVAMAAAARFIIGLTGGVAFVSSLTVAHRWLPPHRFAMVSGLQIAIGTLGGIMGQAPLALMVATYGWRDSMAAASFAVILLAICLWAVVRDYPPSAEGAARSSGLAGTSLLSGLKRVLGNPQSWFAAVYAGMMTSPMLSFAGLWGVPYLRAAYGIEKPVAAASASLVLLGWAIGSPIWGWASDRIGSRRKPMLFGSLLALVTLGLAIYCPGLPLFVVQALLLLHGIGAGSMAVAFATAREHNPPQVAGSVLGMVNALVVSGGAIFPPLIGWILDQLWDGTLAAGARIYAVGDFHWAMATQIGCLVLGLAAALKVKETGCRHLG